jgi:hypothetical protein
VTSDSEKDWRNRVFIETPEGGISMRAMDDSVSFADAAYLPACIPNPLDLTLGGDTRIPFFTEAKALARLMVFTASGYKVYESSEYKSVAGLTDMHWRGTDDEGRTVPGGIYVYAVVADGKILRRDKIAVVR